MRTDSRRGGAEHGLQPVQLEALHYLSLCNRYSDTPMATNEYLGQTKGTVSQTLKVLEKKGFLSKTTDVNDKGVVHLTITRAGDKLLQKFIPLRQFKEACQQLTGESQTQIVSYLKELLQTTQRTNDMKTFGVCHTCRSITRQHFPYSLIQDPGSNNALGRLKFIVPNPWSIYLHDTPSKSLFDKSNRNFSSGCIRVEDPLALANFSLAGNNKHQALLDIISSNKSYSTKLEQPLPVYTIYSTVWCNGNKLIFSPDSYKRDKKMTEYL